MCLAELTERHVAFIKKIDLSSHTAISFPLHVNFFWQQHRTRMVYSNTRLYAIQLAGVAV